MAGIIKKGLKAAGSAIKKGGTNIMQNGDVYAKGVAAGVKEYGVEQVQKTGSRMAKASQVLGPEARRVANRVSGIGSAMVKDDPDKILSLKLTGVGLAGLYGSQVIGGANEGVAQYNENRMGTRDGQITTAAPRVPSYENNAGATGDLVFALNNQRRG